MRRGGGGFSMIEVLVSLVVICLGMLGMVALQSRSIALWQDSVQLSNAMVLANDLLELMRSNPAAAQANTLLKPDGGYAKRPGSPFKTTALGTGESCALLDRGAGGDTLASKDLGCWLNQVKALLPITDDLISAQFAVCSASHAPALPASDASGNATLLGACETTPRATLMIVLAWQDNSGDTLNCPRGVCYYALRSEL